MNKIILTVKRDQETGEYGVNLKQMSTLDAVNIIGMLSKSLREQTDKDKKAKLEKLLKIAVTGKVFKVGENGKLMMSE